MPSLESIKYAFREIQQKGGNKDWRRDRFNQRINSPFQRYIHKNKGIDIVESDWDTLVVLDGCRCDIFEERINTNFFDSYQRVQSRASATNEWLNINFPHEYGDILYVSGNPMVSRHKPNSFYNLVEAWRDGFDKQIETVDASTVTDNAIRAHKDSPNKRLIVHYMQPHYPFVRHPDLRFTSFQGTSEFDVQGDKRASDVWEALGKGFVDKDEVLEGYGANLDYVFKQVKELTEYLGGKTVITSDHGNCIGERSYPIPFRTYGHPPNLRLSALVTVPWATIEGKRRDIVEEDVNSDSTASDTEVDQRLTMLGYKG